MNTNKTTLYIYVPNDYFQTVNIELDGERPDFNPQSPINVNGYFIMVPMRELFEKLGAKIEWNQESKTVVA